VPGNTHPLPLNSTRGAILRVLGAALTFRLVRYEIADHSMVPTLQPGDWVAGIRSRRASQHDVVVFDHPDRPGFRLVKRVASVSSDGSITATGDNPGHTGESLGEVPRHRLRARLLLVYHPRPLRPL
jgi:hypothetical protein